MELRVIHMSYKFEHMSLLMHAWKPAFTASWQSALPRVRCRIFLLAIKKSFSHVVHLLITTSVWYISPPLPLSRPRLIRSLIQAWQRKAFPGNARRGRQCREQGGDFDGVKHKECKCNYILQAAWLLVFDSAFQKGRFHSFTEAVSTSNT